MNMIAAPNDPMIENRTFDEIAVGDSASSVRTLAQEDIDLFAVVSGDVNPAHMDPAYAETDLFHKIIAHGMWGGALISAVFGTRLPGPGTRRFRLTAVLACAGCPYRRRTLWG